MKIFHCLQVPRQRGRRPEVRRKRTTAGRKRTKPISVFDLLDTESTEWRRRPARPMLLRLERKSAHGRAPQKATKPPVKPTSLKKDNATSGVGRSVQCLQRRHSGAKKPQTSKKRDETLPGPVSLIDCVKFPKTAGIQWCGFCGVAFLAKKALKRHVSGTHQEDVAHQHDRELRSHAERELEKSFDCAFCKSSDEASFDSGRELKRHLRVVHKYEDVVGDTRQQCRKCGKTFLMREYLELHQRMAPNGECVSVESGDESSERSESHDVENSAMEEETEVSEVEEGESSEEEQESVIASDSECHLLPDVPLNSSISELLAELDLHISTDEEETLEPGEVETDDGTLESGENYNHPSATTGRKASDANEPTMPGTAENEDEKPRNDEKKSAEDKSTIVAQTMSASALNQEKPDPSAASPCCDQRDETGGSKDGPRLQESRASHDHSVNLLHEKRKDISQERGETSTALHRTDRVQPWCWRCEICDLTYLFAFTARAHWEIIHELPKKVPAGQKQFAEKGNNLDELSGDKKPTENDCQDGDTARAKSVDAVERSTVTEKSALSCGRCGNYESARLLQAHEADCRTRRVDLNWRDRETLNSSTEIESSAASDRNRSTESVGVYSCGANSSQSNSAKESHASSSFENRYESDRGKFSGSACGSNEESVYEESKSQKSKELDMPSSSQSCEDDDDLPLNVILDRRRAQQITTSKTQRKTSTRDRRKPQKRNSDENQGGDVHLQKISAVGDSARQRPKTTKRGATNKKQRASRAVIKSTKIHLNEKRTAAPVNDEGGGMCTCSKCGKRCRDDASLFAHSQVFHDDVVIEVSNILKLSRDSDLHSSTTDEATTSCLDESTLHKDDANVGSDADVQKAGQLFEEPKIWTKRARLQNSVALVTQQSKEWSKKGEDEYSSESSEMDSSTTADDSASTTCDQAAANVSSCETNMEPANHGGDDLNVSFPCDVEKTNESTRAAGVAAGRANMDVLLQLDCSVQVVSSGLDATCSAEEPEGGRTKDHVERTWVDPPVETQYVCKCGEHCDGLVQLFRHAFQMHGGAVEAHVRAPRLDERLERSHQCDMDFEEPQLKLRTRPKQPRPTQKCEQKPRKRKASASQCQKSKKRKLDGKVDLQLSLTDWSDTTWSEEPTVIEVRGPEEISSFPQADVYLCARHDCFQTCDNAEEFLIHANEKHAGVVTGIACNFPGRKRNNTRQDPASSRPRKIAASTRAKKIAASTKTTVLKTLKKAKAIQRAAELKKMNEPSAAMDKVPLSANACQFCPKTFASPHQLRVHRTTLRGRASCARFARKAGTLFQCRSCDKKFRAAQQLQAHLKVCVKAQKCFLCQAAFERPQDLELHFKSHTEEDMKKEMQMRLAECAGVEKQSSAGPQKKNTDEEKIQKEATDLKVEEKKPARQKGEKPLNYPQCDTCGLQFVDEASRRLHSHHDELPVSAQFIASDDENEEEEEDEKEQGTDEDADDFMPQGNVATRKAKLKGAANIKQNASSSQLTPLERAANAWKRLRFPYAMLGSNGKKEVKRQVTRTTVEQTEKEMQKRHNREQERIQQKQDEKREQAVVEEQRAKQMATVGNAVPEPSSQKPRRFPPIRLMPGGYPICHNPPVLPQPCLHADDSATDLSSSDDELSSFGMDSDEYEEILATLREEHEHGVDTGEKPEESGESTDSDSDSGVERGVNAMCGDALRRGADFQVLGAD